jgi:hypothetical protein
LKNAWLQAFGQQNRLFILNIACIQIDETGHFIEEFGPEKECLSKYGVFSRY